MTLPPSICARPCLSMRAPQHNPSHSFSIFQFSAPALSRAARASSGSTAATNTRVRLPAPKPFRFARGPTTIHIPPILTKIIAPALPLSRTHSNNSCPLRLNPRRIAQLLKRSPFSRLCRVHPLWPILHPHFHSLREPRHPASCLRPRLHSNQDESTLDRHWSPNILCADTRCCHGSNPAQFTTGVH